MALSLLRLGLSGFIGVSLMVSSLMLPAIGKVNVTTSQLVVSEKLAEPSDELRIRQLTEQWFAAWSPGHASVDWDAMEQLFAQEAGDLLVFDDAGGSVVVLDSWADYRATWEPFMEQFTAWHIEPEGDIQIKVDGGLATTVFTLTGGGVDQSGNTINFRQRGTHIWQRMGNQWVIVHEHLTTDS